MVRYWSSAHTTETWDNLLRIQKNNIVIEGYGPRKRKRVEQMNPDDFIVFYIVKSKKFAGYGKIMEVLDPSKKPRFPGDIYPNQVKVELQKVLEPEKWVPIHDIIDELEFPLRYPNKSWGLFFRVEPSDFSVFDAHLIMREIDNSSVDRQK